jgi:hypothetical protein
MNKGHKMKVLLVGLVIFSSTAALSNSKQTISFEDILETQEKITITPVKTKNGYPIVIQEDQSHLSQEALGSICLISGYTTIISYEHGDRLYKKSQEDVWGFQNKSRMVGLARFSGNGRKGSSIASIKEMTLSKTSIPHPITLKSVTCGRSK